MLGSLGGVLSKHSISFSPSPINVHPPVSSDLCVTGYKHFGPFYNHLPWVFKCSLIRKLPTHFVQHFVRLPTFCPTPNILSDSWHFVRLTTFFPIPKILSILQLTSCYYKLLQAITGYYMPLQVAICYYLPRVLLLQLNQYTTKTFCPNPEIFTDYRHFLRLPTFSPAPDIFSDSQHFLWLPTICFKLVWIDFMSSPLYSRSNP